MDDAVSAAPTLYQPKGSMCIACQHLQRDCKHLPFHSMPWLSTHPGAVVVKCTAFVKRAPV